MTETVLTKCEDIEWLHEVHGIPTKDICVAVLVGNEDAPEQVVTYKVNDYRYPYAVYIWNHYIEEYEETLS